jgi:hypothetical protein
MHVNQQAPIFILDVEQIKTISDVRAIFEFLNISFQPHEGIPENQLLKIKQYFKEIA